MNLIQLIDFWRADDEFSWNKFFYCCKRILIWQILFLNIIVNVNFFSDLKFKYYCEYYPEILLQVSLKLMGGTTKYFLKKLLGHEIFRSMVSWATNFFFFFEKFIKLSDSPSYILNVRSVNDLLQTPSLNLKQLLAI